MTRFSLLLILSGRKMGIWKGNGVFSIFFSILYLPLNSFGGLPWWLSGKESACQWRRHGFDPWVGKILIRKCQPTPVFLPGKSHGHRSLEGYSPWSHQESDVT